MKCTTDVVVVTDPEKYDPNLGNCIGPWCYAVDCTPDPNIGLVSGGRTYVILDHLQTFINKISIQNSDDNFDYLVVSGYKLGEKEGAILGDALKNNAHKTDLVITGSYITDKGAKSLSEALKDNNTLTSLHVGVSIISHKAMSAIAEALKVNNSIENISFFDIELGRRRIIALADGLKNNHSITSLSFQQVDGIDKIGMAALAEVFKHNHTLLNLRIRMINDLDAKTIAALAEGLKDNNSIVNLNFSICGLGSKQIKPLAEALKVNKSIRHLDLSANNAGNRSFKALAEALKVNNTLKSIDLNYHKTRDPGIIAFAEALKHNTSLTDIDLHKYYSTRITYKGALALADAIRHNSTILSLNLSGNKKIGYNGIKAISEALEGNTSIIRLNLGGSSSFPNTTMQAVMDFYQSYPHLRNSDKYRERVIPLEDILSYLRRNMAHSYDLENAPYWKVSDDDRNYLRHVFQHFDRQQSSKIWAIILGGLHNIDSAIEDYCTFKSAIQDLNNVVSNMKYLTQQERSAIIRSSIIKSFPPFKPSAFSDAVYSNEDLKKIDLNQSLESQVSFLKMFKDLINDKEIAKEQIVGTSIQNTLSSNSERPENLSDDVPPPISSTSQSHYILTNGKQEDLSNDAPPLATAQKGYLSPFVRHVSFGLGNSQNRYHYPSSRYDYPISGRYSSYNYSSDSLASKISKIKNGATEIVIPKFGDNHASNDAIDFFNAVKSSSSLKKIIINEQIINTTKNLLIYTLRDRVKNDIDTEIAIDDSCKVNDRENLMDFIKEALFNASLINSRTDNNGKNINCVQMSGLDIIFYDQKNSSTTPVSSQVDDKTDDNKQKDSNTPPPTSSTLNSSINSSNTLSTTTASVPQTTQSSQPSTTSSSVVRSSNQSSVRSSEMKISADAVVRISDLFQKALKTPDHISKIIENALKGNRLSRAKIFDPELIKLVESIKESSKQITDIKEIKSIILQKGQELINNNKTSIERTKDILDNIATDLLSIAPETTSVSSQDNIPTPHADRVLIQRQQDDTNKSRDIISSTDSNNSDKYWQTRHMARSQENIERRL